MLKEGKVALAAGITWAIATALLGLAVMFFNYGAEMMLVFGSIYLGYDASFGGIILGSIWAFADGAILGLIYAIVYNYLEKNKIMH